jgi:hypothetical protein
MTFRRARRRRNKVVTFATSGSGYDPSATHERTGVAYTISILPEWAGVVEGMKTNGMLAETVLVHEVDEGRRCVVSLTDPAEARKIQNICRMPGSSAT